jgi:hypothetical protein
MTLKFIQIIISLLQVKEPIRDFSTTQTSQFFEVGVGLP